jgi:hypothetical protein
MNINNALKITKSPLSFNSISSSCRMISSMAKKQQKSKERVAGSANMLNGNNIPFSTMEPSYDSHVGPFLFLISSVSPVGE